ncbi:GNAT family N-acetyltransferase [Methylocystis heyeri]|nr:GNAT family N-acetyltransferase [Methylocystis heyeri]
MPTPRAPGTSWDIAVVRDRDGFEALGQEWNDLFARAGHPEHLFQDHRWLSCWADHYLGDAVGLRIVTGRCDGRLAMIWPLVETFRFGRLTRLGWMGEPVSQYGDVLLEQGPRSQELLALGWQAVRALGADLAILRKTRGDSNVGGLLARVATSCENAQAPFADLAGKSADALARRSPKAQSSRRRLLRRLHETGEIAFCAGVEGAEAERLIGAAFAMKREWLLRRGLYSEPIESGAMPDFFLDLLRRKPGPVETLVDAVLRDGEPVAVGVTLSCKGACFGHLLTHDPACEKQGVGILLADHVMKSCLARGMTRYDMLAPFDPYKAEWADGAAPVADWVVGFSPPGRLLARVWSGGPRQRIKTALKKMPPPIGRAFWPLLRRIRGR